MSSGDRSDITLLSELDVPEASRNTFFAILGLGLAFDIAFNGQRPGLSLPLFTLLLGLSIRTVARRSIETDLLLGSAVLLSVFPALRASEPLVAVDVLAIAAMFALAVTQDLGSLLSASVVGLVLRGFALLSRTLAVPRFLAAPLRVDRERGRTSAILRTVAITVPVLVLFASLLASGDRVFARFLDSILPEWNAPNILAHVVLTVVGSVLVAILWRNAIGSGAEPEPERERRVTELLGPSDWITVVAGIDLLFAAFVIVQLRYLFGGAGRVLVTPGLTYAEYARTGFLQMAVAAGLTVLVILAVWDAGVRMSREHDRWFRGLVTAMVGLTFVVLASALKRLALYEGTFGFTINRFFGYVAIASIGAVLVVLILGIWMKRRDRVVAGFLLVGLVALMTVNVLSPDRFVVERNAARYRATGRIDTAYLIESLGSDAAPAIVAIMRTLPPVEADALRSGLCTQLSELGPEPSWRSVNLGRARARAALESAGVTVAFCDRSFAARAG